MLNRSDLVQKLTSFVDLCEKLEFRIWIEQKSFEWNTGVSFDIGHLICVLATIWLTCSKTCLKLTETRWSYYHPMRKSQAHCLNPFYVMQFRRSFWRTLQIPLIYLLSDFGFVLIVCQSLGGGVKLRELTAKFEQVYVKVIWSTVFRFLREIFEKEFVRKPLTAQRDLDKSLKLLERVGILRVNGEEVFIENYGLASFIVNIVEVVLKTL